jgi:hypothetical protein
MPNRHAAAGKQVARAVIGLDLGVVAPQFMPRAGIERHDGIEGRAGDQLVANENRRALEFRALEYVWGAILEIAGMVGPGREQLVNILGQRRKAAAALIVAIIFGRAGSGGQCDEHDQQDGERPRPGRSPRRHKGKVTPVSIFSTYILTGDGADEDCPTDNIRKNDIINQTTGFWQTPRPLIRFKGLAASSYQR